MRTYADVPAYVAWTGSEAPANILSLLRSASILVRAATVTACYETDDDGYPTDAVLVEAMRDAACSHAAALAAAGVDPASAGAVSAIASTSIGGASITYADAGAFTARQRLATTLCPEALRILHDAGLHGGPPGSFSGFEPPWQPR